MGNRLWTGLKEAARSFADEYLPPAKMLLVMGACAIPIGLFVLWGVCSHRHQMLHDDGQLANAHLVALSSGGNALIVAERVTHGGKSKPAGRIDSIDLANGHRLARVVLARPTECTSAGPGLVWCRSGDDGALEVRDATTLAVRTTSAKLLAGAPAGINPRPSIDRTSRLAWFVASDGRSWHVDARSLASGIAATGLNPSDATDMDRSEALHATVDRLDGPGATGWYSFVGEPRSVLTFTDGRPEAPPRQIAPQTTLIAPKFVTSEEQDPGRALRVGAFAIVAHADSVDPATAGLLISAISLDGSQQWTAPFPDSDLAGAWIVDHRIVLAIRGHDHHDDGLGIVVALDPADGHVVWRTGT